MFKLNSRFWMMSFVFCLFGTSSSADIIRTLLNTPVSVLDLGIHRIEHRLELMQGSISRNVQKHTSIENLAAGGLVKYNDNMGTIDITFNFAFGGRNKYDAEKYPCDMLLTTARQGSNLDYAGGAANLFFYVGTPDRETGALIERNIKFIGRVIGTDGSNRVITLEKCFQDY